MGDYVILINAEALTLDRNIRTNSCFQSRSSWSSLKRLVNALPQQNY